MKVWQSSMVFSIPTIPDRAVRVSGYHASGKALSSGISWYDSAEG